MSQLCQFQIFFALLAGVVLKTDPTELETAWLGTILTVMCAVPPFIGLAVNSKAVRSLFDAKRRQKAVSSLSKYVLRPISDRLCRGRSSKAKRSKAKAANAWSKSMKMTNAQDAVKARSVANLLASPTGAKAGTPIGAAKLAALRGAAAPSAPSLLAQIKMAKAVEGESRSMGQGPAESDLEAPSLRPKKGVSFIAAAAAAGEPARQARVVPSPSRVRVAPALFALSPGRLPPVAPPAQKQQLDLESHLAISPRQSGAASPAAAQKTPTQPFPTADIHISDV